MERDREEEYPAHGRPPPTGAHPRPTRLPRRRAGRRPRPEHALHRRRHARRPAAQPHRRRPALEESIAAVGAEDLSGGDTELTENFDGWTKVAAVGDARRLVFTRGSTESSTRLRWSRADGFAQVEEIPR
ncbi:hypothetical protein ABT330_19285 [Streptomyces sp. NPDC000658]|uniref:hypothetical protein n=1 Tax=Streptomyces sp. NPDC000658 TaxID=3154266 RepID=UPI00332E8FBD